VKRGDIYWVNLTPSIGSEASKTRPAVIVSNDGNNRSVVIYAQGTITVAPITSNTQHIYSFQVAVPAGTAGLRDDSKIQAEQIRTVDTRRIGDQIGSLDATLMTALDKALRLHLSL
jgi:mRNA interferase MazF